MAETTDMAMQIRCIYCKAEQYGSAVYDISLGEHPCVWCGKTPPQLSNASFWAIIREDKEPPEALSSAEGVEV